MNNGTTNYRAIKTGVFFDGSYFTHVSNYYNYVHEQRRRIHIGGLHDFIKHTVAMKEGTHPSLCHIVDSHFFRGRFSARDANEKVNQLYYDRVFDDVLMYNNVQTHYLPVKDMMGRKREKGVDVMMALETYELAMLKKLDLVVLVASDSDHLHLVKKLHALGCKTMLLGWDFEFNDQETGMLQTTKTSTDLWNEVSYPIPMHDRIDEGLKNEEQLIDDLFVAASTRDEERTTSMESEDADDLEFRRSEVMSLHNGYGFISYPDNNLFFIHDDVITPEDFNELSVGDEVEFNIGINNKGQRVARNISKMEVEA